MTLGPLMIDLLGTEMTTEENEIIHHPLVGGVILFSRNYDSVEQVSALIKKIQANRKTHLVVAVDHEGGAVQRFRNEFTRLPACAEIGKVYDHDTDEALELSYDLGWVMASELRTVGVDLSFAPILDLGGISRVINDRAFHRDPNIIATLAFAYRRGMHDSGMSAVGKHFPGHGSIAEDSHHEIPVDERTFAEIEKHDLIPFKKMIDNGLEAMMPAHVIYPQVDKMPAGFSTFWLQEVLRKKLNFQGAIFSDDMSMAGAAVGGDFVERSRAALGAGCDMVLICNNPEGAIQVLDHLGDYNHPVSQARLIRMHGRHTITREQLAQDKNWQDRVKKLNKLNPDQELDLGDDQLL